MTYYVIRNQNTGEYWRGKGFSWDKIYRAIIYADKVMAERNLERIFRMGYLAEIVPIEITEVKTDD